MALGGKNKNATSTKKKLTYVWDVSHDHISWEGDPTKSWKITADTLPSDKSQFNALINPQDLPLRLSIINTALSDGRQNFDLTYRLRSSDGSHVYVKEEARIEQDKNGCVIVYGKMKFLKATKKKTKKKSVQQEKFNNLKMVGFDGADHSGRHAMYQEIQEWMDENKSLVGKGYVLAVGIDRLSLFNEAFGTDYADYLIEETGKHLEHVLLKKDIHISRINGDIYGLLIRDGLESEMSAVAHYILGCFYEMPIHTDIGPIRIGISIGGMTLGDKEMQPASVLAKAEMALRSAKDRGRGCFVSYAQTTQQTEEYRSMLITGDSFLNALEDNRVRLAFQPVVDSKSKDVSFYECLVRIIDGEGGMVNAAQFVPAVEELGLARVLDKYTMRLAVEELRAYPDLNLSVNVSNWSLTDDGWLRAVIGALDGRRDIAERLIIEITESVAIQDLKKTEDFVNQLKEMGCRIALDDFGAGYTAFTHLQKLHVDFVKIDKSFVSKMNEGQNALFVKALHSLAEGINIQTVGEGAETQDTADALTEGGIHHIQGYLYGRPSTERVWLPENHAERHFAEKDVPLNLRETQGSA